MNKLLIGVCATLVVMLTMSIQTCSASVDTYKFKSEEHQKRALSLAHSLRCPQCQNQNLIDSNSPVADDLRLEVYEMVSADKTEAEIIEFMTSRYGDFVLYKPRVEPKTLVLWLGPLGLLLIALAIGFVFIRKQRITAVDDVDISADEQSELDELLKRDAK